METNEAVKQEETVKPEQIKKLRAADFKVGIVLLVVSLAILVETLGFPMSGSYGGVESQWYVSPALFPLIIVSILIISTLLLLTSAVKEQGFRHFFSLNGWIGDLSKTINIDRWYVIFQLVLLIYVLVPSADFYLSTVTFLTAITFRFYIDAPRIIKPLLAIQAATIVGLFILRTIFVEEFYFFSLEPVSNETLIKWSDYLLLAGIIGNYILLIVCHRPDKATLARLALTCWFVPLILVFAFSMLLYIPMPVEYGTVSQLLEFLWYDTLNM